MRPQRWYFCSSVMTLPNSLVKLFTDRPWTELRSADFNTLRLEQVVTISSLPWTLHPSFYSPPLGISSKLLAIRKKIKYQSLQMLSLFSCISDGRCKYSNKHSLKDINVSISNVTLCLHVHMQTCPSLWSLKNISQTTSQCFLYLIPRSHQIILLFFRFFINLLIYNWHSLEGTWTCGSKRKKGRNDFFFGRYLPF